MKVFFHTLGCKVNQYETEVMRLEFLKNGFTLCENGKESDITVVNSCTVTAESDRKTRQLVRRYKRINENSVVVLTGCMPQAFLSDAKQLPADIICGNAHPKRIVDYVKKYLENKKRIIDVTEHKTGEKFAECNIENFNERTRAYMKIEDGCDRGCTYCIIPKARGRVRSRNISDIEKEAQTLAENGYVELVLVGINLSAYGKDLGLSLADAVDAASKPKGIKRIRLGSLEPDLTDKALLERLSKNEKFCPQFHLALQSGCDDTLKRMNRHYNTAEYENVVKIIRELFENPSITTDIMVGFIGETDEEFECSVAFAEKMEILKAHVFPYSVRNGTTAAKMSGRVDENVKTKRAAIMAKRCNASSQKVMEKMCGKECNVLFETSENGYAVGYSENYAKVYVAYKSGILHTVCKVLLKSVKDDGILGEIII